MSNEVVQVVDVREGGVLSVRGINRANDGLLRLIEVADDVVRELEMSLDELRWDRSQPLAQGNILEAIYIMINVSGCPVPGMR